MILPNMASRTRVAKINLGQMINTLANIGVLVGIIFLAIEISQNQASLEEANRINIVDARDATLESFINRGHVVMQDEELSRIELSGDRGDDLNDLDEKRYRDLCGGRIWITAATFERWTALEMPTRANAAVETLRAQISSNPGLRRCWEDLRNGVTLWDFREFVDAIDAE